MKYLVFLVIPFLLYAQTEFEIQMNHALVDIKTDFNIIGFSVIVYDQDELIFSNGYGLSDVERLIPITNNTKYRIASISKIVTAIAVMQLYERNLVDLDEDISLYLGYDVFNPNFPDQPVTLRNLMTHTSSLRDSDTYFNFLNESYGTNNPHNLAELLRLDGEYYQTDIWSSFYEPGNADGWDYCNLGAGVVATIVEKISNQLFHEYCRENIFSPLEMDVCWQDFENLSDINLLSVLYRYNNEGVPIPQADNFSGIYPDPIDWQNIEPGTNALIHGPQGSFRTSGEDLAKIMQAFTNNGIANGYQLLDRETITEMFQEQWSGYGLGGFFTNMGLQFQITEEVFPEQTMFGHAGEAYGLLSDMYFTENQGIIFIMNGANYSYGEGIFYDVEEAVFNAIWDLLPLVSNQEDSIEESLFCVHINPNPAFISNQTEISLVANKPLKSIDLYNCKGQKVWGKRNIFSHSMQIDIINQRIAAGMYFLRASNDRNDVQFNKILIVK